MPKQTTSQAVMTTIRIWFFLIFILLLRYSNITNTIARFRKHFHLLFASLNHFCGWTVGLMEAFACVSDLALVHYSGKYR